MRGHFDAIPGACGQSEIQVIAEKIEHRLSERFFARCCEFEEGGNRVWHRLHTTTFSLRQGFEIDRDLLTPEAGNEPTGVTIFHRIKERQWQAHRHAVHHMPRLKTVAHGYFKIAEF